MARTAMLLGAGYGTRLRPLTDERPKPLVPVGDRSVAAHISRTLAAAGFEQLVINTHHLPSAWDDATLALPATFIREVGEILGTAGGVAHAMDALHPGDLCVHAGDILAELDVEALQAQHAERDAFATMAVVGALPKGQGSVGIGAAGSVVRLRHGRFGEEVAGADFVGVQMLSTRAQERLPSQGCLVGDVYIPALERGERVIAASVATGFSDIGTPRAYLDANLAWLAKHGFEHYTAPHADVDAALSLARSIVGEGATVSGSGTAHALRGLARSGRDRATIGRDRHAERDRCCLKSRPGWTVRCRAPRYGAISPARSGRSMKKIAASRR